MWVEENGGVRGKIGGWVDGKMGVCVGGERMSGGGWMGMGEDGGVKGRMYVCVCVCVLSLIHI